MESRFSFPCFIPHLLVVGQQRCGTSALHKYLLNFPEVVSLPRPKESHFFDKRFNYGFHWYRRCYPRVLKNQLVLEFCPSYLTSLAALYRLHYYSKLAPVSPTIVVISRNKEQQISSLLNYRYQRKQIAKPLEELCLSRDVLSADLLSDSLISLWKMYFPDLVEISYNSCSLIPDFLEVLNQSKLLPSPIPFTPSRADFVNLSQGRYLNQRYLSSFKPCKEMAIRLSPRLFYS